MNSSDPRKGSESKGLPRATLRILAVVAFSLAATIHRVELSAVAALLGLILVAWSYVGNRPIHHERTHVWAGMGALSVIALSWISRVGPAAPSEEAMAAVYQGLLIVGILLAILRGRTGWGRRVVVAVCLASVVLITAWILASEWDSEAGTDVYLAHAAAGEALFDGENPYGEAVRFPDGNPHNPSDAVIIGYPYPPPVLSTYASTAVLGDSRIVSAVAWLGVLTVVSGMALRRGRAGDAAFALLIVLAATPAWPIVVFVAWTEPLSLALLFAAISLWRRKWFWSAVLLGLALASKQYFILLLPPLALMKVDHRMRRLGVAAATAFIAWMPPLVFGAGDYLTATVTNLLDIGFRPDSQSLSGLAAAYGADLMIPRFIWLAMIGAVGVVAGYQVRSRVDVALGFAFTLGFAFWTGLAFPNYWFLVMGITAVGMLLTEVEAENVRVREATRWRARAAV